jgi:hypothetical protein
VTPYRDWAVQIWTNVVHLGRAETECSLNVLQPQARDGPPYEALVEYATKPEYDGIHMCLAAWTDEMLGPPKNAFLAAAREQGYSVEAGT